MSCSKLLAIIDAISCNFHDHVGADQGLTVLLWGLFDLQSSSGVASVTDLVIRSKRNM